MIPITMAEELTQVDYFVSMACSKLVNSKLRIKRLANGVSSVIGSVVNFGEDYACHQNGLSTCHLLEDASTHPSHL